jgi:hypothetical protein
MCCRGFGAILVDVSQNDVGSISNKTFRASKSDSFRRARNDHYLAFESHDPSSLTIMDKISKMQVPQYVPAKFRFWTPRVEKNGIGGISAGSIIENGSTRLSCSMLWDASKIPLRKTPLQCHSTLFSAASRRLMICAAGRHGGFPALLLTM